MKTIKACILLLSLCMAASANDGVYFVSGNQLVPIHDTDIACAKEVLTIELNDDGFARVDVQYEFLNRGQAKTVDMGFEAAAPYNDGSEVDNSGRHPHIFDFTVTLNGERLTYTNAVIKGHNDFEPLDMSQWRRDRNRDDMGLINISTNESISFAYAYVFKADFKSGKNVIHHTYRYRMSNGISRTFEVPYWLTPAKRWANHQIDDFTLRISTPSFKQFMLEKKLFSGAQFRIISGKGKIRDVELKYEAERIEIALRNGTVEWHKRDFDPSDDFTIASSDTYAHLQEDKLGIFYDRSDSYVPRLGSEYTVSEKRILRNLPYANRGYVFKDKALRAYFNKIWWYMPDPTWKQNTSDFTKREWELIKKGE